MDFNGPLLKGKLIKRYKRFLADIQLDDGRLITAHCANSGSMMGLKDEGLAVWVTEVPKESQRKLRYDWHLVQAPHSNHIGLFQRPPPLPRPKEMSNFGGHSMGVQGPFCTRPLWMPGPSFKMSNTDLSEF